MTTYRGYTELQKERCYECNGTGWMVGPCACKICMGTGYETIVPRKSKEEIDKIALRQMSGAGHQLTSESRAMKSSVSNLEEAYHALTKAGNATEVLDIRSEIHRIINRLNELACAAEEQYNQND